MNLAYPPVLIRSPVSPLEAMLKSLEERRFFKLIGGGSLTEAGKIAHVVRAYALAGTDCLDLAPDLELLETVATVLTEIPHARPAVMVSLPLDPDPHFHKIALQESDCIRCGLCLPVCPTAALTLPECLEISQPLCYGCGRCVPVCPTDALSLLPFQVESQLEAVLSHPLVQAVEIHSRYVDPYMLSAFLARWAVPLSDKLLSLCFRVDGVPEAQIREFYAVADAFSALPVILQIDGAPMSGNDDPEASRPALDSAVRAMEIFREDASLSHPPIITISGGINPHTAHLLREARYRFIAGAGMGTVARQAVWSLDSQSAVEVARRIVSAFQG